MLARDFFKQSIVFRYSEFKQFMKAHAKSFSDKNCEQALRRYCQKGILQHVRKGLYVVKNEHLYQATTISPLLIVAKATDDAVLVYHTALESHGVAYTDFNEHTYLTGRTSPNFEFDHQQFRAIYRPYRPMANANKADLGVESVTMLGIQVRRTNLERTVVDVLDRPELAGGWEEVMRSLDRVVSLNTERAVRYAIALGKASLVAKLGYFLEQRPDYLNVDAKIINRLLPHIPKKPYYIDRRSSIGRGTYLKKWQIIVPNTLYERQWEEPEHAIDY